MMTELGVVLLVLLLAVPAWVYLGYPLLVGVLALVAEKPFRRGPFRGLATFIVPAHDEEKCIEAKVRNAFAAGLLPARLEVLVVSDGSTDETVARVRALGGDLPVRVLDLPRVGKGVALNTAVTEASGSILVFSDANALLEAGALATLLEPFADPGVGGVAGNQRYRVRPEGEAGTGQGESAYWSFDTWLKAAESRIGSCYAADGSLYALRRELYVPIEDPAQADDMAISMRVVTAGHRLVLVEGAVAWEEAPSLASTEFSRKIRVTNHSLRSLLLLGGRLWRSGFYTLELVSHKLLRHLVPLFLVPAFLLSLVLSPASLTARVLLLPQLCIYGLAALGFALRRSPSGGARLLTVPYYFCLANAAALVGSLQVLKGRRIVSWRPERSP